MSSPKPEPVRVSPMQRLTRFLRGLTIDPIETLLIIPEVFGREAREDYQPDFVRNVDWQERLHDWLGVEWPCTEYPALDRILLNIREELAQHGLRFGRFTTGIEYSDAELNLSRAVWCAACHLDPLVVIETGVARGTTSRIVLEALSRNAKGHLYSVDLPYPFDSSQHKYIGVAVPLSRSYRDRWTYIKGSSRRRLPGLVRGAKIDLFIHDSLHTGRNVKFEMETVFPHMTPGGIMIVDDIASHRGFYEFVQEHPNCETLVVEHSDISESYFGILRIAT